MADVDPFVVMAAGRCPFRVEDLLALADLAEQSKPARREARRFMVETGSKAGPRAFLTHRARASG
jgi:hypothetical protein